MKTLLSTFIFLSLAFIGGCVPIQYSEVILGTDGSDVYLCVLEKKMPGVPGTFTVYSHSAKENSGSWSNGADFHGLVTSFDGDGIGGVPTLFFSDCSVFSATGNFRTLTTLAESLSGYKLFSAIKAGDRIYGLLRNDDGKFSIHELVKNEQRYIWKKLDIPLPFPETASMLILAEYRDMPLLIWRPGNEREIRPGLLWAYYKDGKWLWPPVPPGPMLKGFFAVCSYNDSFLLVQEGSSHNRGISLSRFKDGSWSQLPSIPVSEDDLGSVVFSLDIVASNNKVFVARKTDKGFSLYCAPEFPEDFWQEFSVPDSLKGSPWWQDWSFLFLFVITAFMFMFVFRRLMLMGRNRNGIEDASLDLRDRVRLDRIGGFATPLDRAVAMGIDGMICMALPLGYVGYDNIEKLQGITVDSSEMNLFFMWIGSLAIYGFIMEALWGRTLGKFLLGMRVRNITGGRASNLQVCMRNLARFIDFFPVFGGGFWYLIGLLAVIFSSKRQRIGDMIGRTVVRYHTPVRKRDLVLASSSPRRREFFEQMGLTFTVINPDIDEDKYMMSDPAQSALNLARRKADAVALEADKFPLVVAADTLVVLDEQVLGKPKDREHAKEMLESLSGRSHMVMTAISMIDKATGQRIDSCTVSEVEMRRISSDEIDAYLAGGEADDKAGAYAIQGEGGKFVSFVRGSISNVIGLPVEALVQMFADIEG